MFDGLSDKLFALLGKERKVTGLRLILSDERLIFSGTVLCLKKGVLTSLSTIPATEGIEALLQHIDTNIPIALSVEGRGVLHKKLALVNQDNATYLQQVLPNSQEQDFYFQHLAITAHTLVSIARKSTIDAVLGNMQQAGLQVIQVSLGIGAVASLFPLIEENHIKIGSYHLEGNATSGCTAIQTLETPSEASLSIGTDKIVASEIIPYANALQALLPDWQTITASIPQVDAQTEEYKEKHRFQTTGWIALMGMLVILMVNFGFYSYYSSINSELLKRNTISSGTQNSKLQLQKAIKEKEDFLTHAGWMDNSKAAYFADRIAASVPSSVKLTTLNIAPLDEKASRTAKKNVFNVHSIVLKGTTVLSTSLNPWLKELENIQGIENAQITGYSFDNKNAIGVFSIELQMN